MKRGGFETPVNYGHRLIHDPGFCGNIACAELICKGQHIRSKKISLTFSSHNSSAFLSSLLKHIVLLVRVSLRADDTNRVSRRSVNRL